MKGLEVSKKFYKEFGEKMLCENFSEIKNKISVGLIGAGSECFSYDDDVSTDHDFDPGFLMFIPDDFDDKTIFKLEHAYSKLPKEFMGYKRNALNPVGGNRRGVKKISDFLYEKTGSRDGNLTLYDYLKIPEESLAEVVNGEIWSDESKVLTKIRLKLMVLPDDIRLKKLAGEILLMAQAGQYNFKRCIEHSEYGAAKLALYEFIKSTIHATFLLNEVYMPYYKWQFRALRDLSWPNALMTEKITNGRDVDEFNNMSFEDKLIYFLNLDKEDIKSTIVLKRIEKIAEIFINRLKKDMLSISPSNYLEPHAYEINNKIKNNDLRNMHILAAV